MIRIKLKMCQVIETETTSKSSTTFKETTKVSSHSNVLNVEKSKQFSKRNKPKNILLGDSITHAINIAELERKSGKFIHLPWKKGTNGAKTDRCYTSLKGGKFPNNSYSKKLPEILEKTAVDNLYLQTPTNDISNMNELINENGYALEGCNDEVNKKAYNSSLYMTRFATITLETFPDIKILC